MAKYWEKRPEFEAVQLLPENLEVIKNMTGGRDVGFSDTHCYLQLYDRLTRESHDTWLVKKPNTALELYDPQRFNEDFELVINSNIILVQNNTSPIPLKMRGE